jgi:hypothetical protein
LLFEGAEVDKLPQLLIVQPKEELILEARDDHHQIFTDQQLDMQQSEPNAEPQSPDAEQLETHRRLLQQQFLQQQAAQLFFQQQIIQQQQLQQQQSEQQPHQPQQLLILNDYDAKYLVPPAVVRPDEKQATAVKTKDASGTTPKTVTPVKCKYKLFTCLHFF